MKNILSKIWAFALLIVAGLVAFQSCAKDETETVAAATTKPDLKAASRTDVRFNDVQPPATVNGYTLSNVFITNHGTDNDTIRVVSSGMVDVKALLYFNVCSLNPDSLAAGFVQNDTFRTKAPVAWMNCFGTQPPNQVWDALIEY